MMILMGFIVYYLIPYTFTFGDLPLFFLILILILLGMLGGLSLIGTTIQPYAERVAVLLLIWGEDRRTLSQLIRKNLSSHSRRNIKTALMFTTSLAFIIFAGTSFSLQGHTIAETVQLASGADLLVWGPISGDNPLNEKGLRGYLQEEMARKNPLVKGFTFSTPALSTYSFIRSTSVSNLAGFPSLGIDVYGIDRDYLDETYVRFYRPTEVSSQFSYKKTPDGKPDAVDSLYRHAGLAQLPQEKGGIRVPPDVTSDAQLMKDRNETDDKMSNEQAYRDYIDVIISEATRYGASLDTSTPLKLSLSFSLDKVNTSRFIYLCKPRAMVRQFPGFFFSSYRQTAYASPILVSMDSYFRLYNETYYAAPKRTELWEDVPRKQALHIDLKKGVTKVEQESVIDGISNFIDDDLTRIIDSADVVDSTRVAIDLLTLFFNLISVVACVLCFFVLWLSFTANVRENAWEFGVLRAVGLNSFKVIRMYIYEALCLIISSVLIGTIIGMLVSITLTLQFNLFTELAFTFDFPYALFFSVLGMSLIVAVLGSYIPAYELKKKDIAIALKNM